MPIPFDMLAVMLYLGYYAESPVADPPPPGLSLLTVLAGCLGLALASLIVNRISLSSLRRRRLHRDRRRLAGTAELVLRLLLVASYVLVLEESALPWSAARALGWDAAGQSFLLQVLGLAPFVLLFFAAWLPMYGLHRETSYGAWTRLSFIIHKARYNLYMLLAWIPFALLAEWLSGFLIAMPFLFLLAAWAFPYVLAKAWGCSRLPEGEIMDTVRRLEQTAGAGFSRVYLWEPGGGGIQNAAAVGIFRPFRYLFLTPALIRNMKPPELEAVILHELGHVRKKHLLFYLFTTLAGINIAVLLGALLPYVSSSERFIVTAALIFAYFRLVFGVLSRNMECQADLFALEKSGSAGGLANALEKLGLGAGNIRLAASWHHLGIAERVDFLRRAERDPDLGRRHNAGVTGLMWVGYTVAVAIIVLIGASIYGEYASLSGPGTVTARNAGGEAHWRRLLEIMPGDLAASLELAYSLAGRTESRDEALELADQVRRESRDGDERAAADKLIRELTRTAALPPEANGEPN